MSKINFSCEWLSAGQDEPEVRDTSAQLSIFVDDMCLTQCEDIWSKTVRNSVLVSAYPLATWLASSWWRLMYEPMPTPGVLPSVDWRMSHELGAANHGFVWPQVVFATDGDAMQVWAVPSKPDAQQSVRYLNGLSGPRMVPLSDFESAVDSFIGSVLSRLNALGHTASDLAALWSLIQDDRADTASAQSKRFEAKLGYDPDECPEEVLKQAKAMEQTMGESALSELAPVFGQRNGNVALKEIVELGRVSGLEGTPEISKVRVSDETKKWAPWERAVDAARRVREQIGNVDAPIEDKQLYGLLGLTSSAVEHWQVSATRQRVAVAVPERSGLLKFVPRKKHPDARRFEFARFLGDFISQDSRTDTWLAATDLATSRQKFQRAFAAEFLCPIKSLAEFLDGDFSESAIEDAGAEFGVSGQTVESLLANNGYIAPLFPATAGLPYRPIAA